MALSFPNIFLALVSLLPKKKITGNCRWVDLRADRVAKLHRSALAALRACSPCDYFTLLFLCRRHLARLFPFPFQKLIPNCQESVAATHPIVSLLSFDIIYAILYSARRRGINICKVFLSLFPFEGACNEMVHICWPFFWFTGKCHARYVTLSCCCCWQHKTSASINYHFISGARQFDVTPRSTIVRRRWRCDGSSSWWRHRLTADDEKPCFSIFNE